MPGKEFSIYGKHSHKKNKLNVSPNEILLSNFFFFFFSRSHFGMPILGNEPNLQMNKGK